MHLFFVLVCVVVLPIVQGAKTGLMAVVVAVLFLLSAFIGPLLSAVPHVATAVPLVLSSMTLHVCCSI